ncbi:2-amino-4-hydroxy-6-hydroxymethyldihydropteridine diphosphokinase [Thermotoga sp. KOL6]|uniref:2-amino-4-hydroxy-6- hydroxymethyldihydropteridine diphosphokinase n=1 Tax=Thermotoga sp. KOL6 TaxID=126741 RepID=UPI001E296598|nr:2-amino-4-hydroxy-6-hydroxymethyldihydropteridine diphosphokinase [Thermotoga sp. KOL6]
MIALGSNLGNRKANIETAIEKMKEKGLSIEKISTIVETEPYGYVNQPKFLNAVCLANTSLSPRGLLETLLSIEKEMGRKRTRKWGPRIIDLDIIFYNELVVREKDLVIPHPDAHNRFFVLEPLCEIAPNFVHPVFKKTVRELLDDLRQRK